VRYFFDESGSFRVPLDRHEHAVGIVVGLVVPETEEAELWQRFREFVAKLPRSAFKRGEPKGNRLDQEARRAFAILVSQCQGILICPTMLDLTTMAGRAEEERNGIVTKIETTAASCKHQSMQQEVELLARQVANLSPEAAFRLGSWAQCVKRSIDDSIIWHSLPEFNSCWTNMSFEMDPVQPSSGSREEQVFTIMLPGWVTAWSQKRPFTLIKEIHTDTHPFVRRWDTQAGIDLGRMLRNNVRFCKSSHSLGVQIADMAASVVRRAVAGIVTPVDLMSYGLMMSKSLRSATHAHGIFSFAETDPDDIARRYSGLVEAVSQARAVTPRSYALPDVV